ncbi:hypothetical protein MKEN_00535800 [Mycena kentingensis (nom. inval.)]|nr:hypothetical protein MKEN_00535800 [Mycena kentingensis (nom. inval.)]
MRRRLAKALGSGAVFVVYTLGAVVCWPVILYSCLVYKSKEPTPSTPRPDPDPLPTQRIDIQVKWQPEINYAEDCYFLTRLPLELRQLVYEYALGGRRIRIYVTDNRESTRRIVRSRLNVVPFPPPMPWRPQEKLGLPLSLLLVCRQIYLEAHPIILRTNSFDVLPYEFGLISRCGLGQTIALPHIRRLTVRYWLYALRPLSVFTTDLNGMFEQIALMRCLTHLTFQFCELENFSPGQPNSRVEYEPLGVLDSVWGQSLLAIRHLKLQKLRIEFAYREDRVSAPPPEAAKWKELEGRLNDMMVGEGRDDAYGQFMQAKANIGL